MQRLRFEEGPSADGGLRLEAKRIGNWELGMRNAELIEGGIQLVEERFRLRSTSYGPTCRLRLEAGASRFEV